MTHLYTMRCPAKGRATFGDSRGRAIAAALTGAAR